MYFSDKPCNDYVDNVLNQMKADKEFFEEPYELTENENSIGMYNVERAYIYGLNTIHRVDDVVVAKKKGSTRLKVYLGAGELSLNCDVKKKLLHIGKPVNVDAVVPFVTMELDVVPKPDGSNPEIKNFKIDEVKGLKVTLGGRGIISDFLLNTFHKFVERFFNRMVKRGIEDRLKRFLANKVKDYPVPTECLNDA